MHLGVLETKIFAADAFHFLPEFHCLGPEMVVIVILGKFHLNHSDTLPHVQTLL